MDEFFKTLPFNTARIFSRHVTSSGCEIYVPAESEQHAEQNKIIFDNFIQPDDEPEPPEEAA